MDNFIAIPETMDRLTALEVFTAVAEAGSFTAAAERLTLSRAKVTRHVADLERWLGTRLLQRTTRRVTLTGAGENCLVIAQRMLSLDRDLREEIAPADGQLRGRLRLTCSISFGHAHLAAALGEFLARHPLLKVDLDVGDRALNLVESRIDLAIRIAPEPDAGLIARPLAACESLLAASPAYLARHDEPAEPADLARHCCFGHSNYGRSEWFFRRGADQVRVHVDCRFTANEATALLQAAAGGAGIAMLPVYLAAPALAEGRLRQVLADWSPPMLTIYAVYTSRRHLPPAVRALIDFLVERFAHPPWHPGSAEPDATRRRQDGGGRKKA